MTDDLVGRPLWDAFCDLCNTHGPRGYGRDSKERIAFGADLNAFWQLVEADHQIAADRIEALQAEKAEWLGIMRHLVEGRGRDLARAIIAKEDANVRP